MISTAKSLREQVGQEHEKDTSSIESLLSRAQESLGHAQAIQKKKKILIVDDNAYILQLLSRILELGSFKVVTAQDGLLALSSAEAEKPDLMIIDFNIPHLNGAQVIRTLREDLDFKDVPILAITAYGHWAASQAMEAGADRTMMKPIEPDLLIECVQELFAQANDS